VPSDVGSTRLVEITDADFAALLRGDGTLRDGLVVPPGGVDEPFVLEHVRGLAATLHAQGYTGGHWMVVAGGEVVGLCGFKHVPSPSGEVEIGYGMAASRRRRGHATAAVTALLDAARRDPAVRAVLAQTAVDNVASQRVLAKNGFARIGTSHDPEDGALIVWRIALRDDDNGTVPSYFGPV
jgi:RimJ/RimL family protein N-acetyltransferase